MSRIGRIPLKIPEGTQLQVQDHAIFVTGPKGSLKTSFSKDFLVDVGNGEVRISAKEDASCKNISAMHGTLCRNVANMLTGVSQGFEKKLELVGVGYKADLQGSKLKLALGYSHDIFYAIPDGITIVMEKPTLFKILGADKQKVGQTAAEIIRYRPPEPYKGKGVRVPGQFLRMKEGKSK